MDKNVGDGTLSSASGNKNGTVGTNCTVIEYGNETYHVSSITVTGVAYVIGDTAALGIGALIYTFPAGIVHVQVADCSVGLNLTTGTPTSDTPEIGLGTTIGSGANATLGAVDAAAENIAGPSACDDIAGTAEAFNSLTAEGTKTNTLVIAAAADHTVYLNFADTWANVDNTAATATGTVRLAWTLLQ